MKIAIVTIGYGDGVPRHLSNNGRVLTIVIHGPIIGRVCMDQIMVDVSNVEQLQPGDVATIWGKRLIYQFMKLYSVVILLPMRFCRI